MSDKLKKQNKKKQKKEDLPQKAHKKRKTSENEATEKKSVQFTSETIDNEVPGDPVPKKKRNKEIEAPLSADLEEEINKPENKKDVTSKRQTKRAKYQKLLAETKLKNETQMQQKVLNYLSQWKHNREEWRFEKIKQIWLQTHMFDSARVPEEFWDTTVQYFGGSKGRIRQVLIDNCMKIVDNTEKSEGESEKEEDEDEKDEADENENKLKRARELLQHLQE